MSVAHNKDGATDLYYETRSVMDIQGNVLEVVDARGNIAEERTYGMLGQPLEVISHDAGNRTNLLDALGQPFRSWDSRDQRFSFTYDALRRPVDRTVSVDGAAEKLLGRVVYGDLLGTPTTTNHAGRVYRVYDGAGVATTTAFDFKGQPTSETRQLVANKTAEPDWSVLLGESTIAQMSTAVATASLLDTAETFSASSERDALGRVLVAVSPDGSEVAYGYDEGGGLQTVELKHRGSSTAQTVVGEIAYDARGQRTRVVYGSTSSPTSTTRYTYDPQTFRLSRLWTERGSDSAGLQSLFYHYDPVGNVTEIRDTAQQTVYFNNSVVEAANSYVYDAVYRLVEAEGREHSADGTGQRTHEQLPVGPQPMTSDPSAMRRYTQYYSYDAVGNLLSMQHVPGGGGTGWTRHYDYATGGNRLLGTSAPGDPPATYSHTYTYDAHGSMTSMPHLSSMVWGHDDALQQVTVGTETVSFQYAGGIRSRKFVEKSGAVTEERIYLGGWEVYRRRVSGALDVERESLHVSDGSGRMLLVETKTVDGGTPVSTPVGMWRYQLGNHLGSAAGEIDETGAVISYEEYHPYGTSAYRAVDSSVEVSARRYRYTGMERDEETGLGYHSARYYAPWLGRWTAADPIGLRGGVNRFAYVENRPSALVDLKGTNGNEPNGQVILRDASYHEFYAPEGGALRVQLADGSVETASQVTNFNVEPIAPENDLLATPHARSPEEVFARSQAETARGRELIEGMDEGIHDSQMMGLKGTVAYGAILIAAPFAVEGGIVAYGAAESASVGLGVRGLMAAETVGTAAMAELELAVGTKGAQVVVGVGIAYLQADAMAQGLPMDLAIPEFVSGPRARGYGVSGSPRLQGGQTISRNAKADRLKWITSSNFRKAVRRLRAHRQAQVEELARQTGWEGSVRYSSEEGTASHTLGSNDIPRSRRTIVITPHAFREPGGVKSVFMHELAHHYLPQNATEVTVDMMAVQLAEEIFGHSDDIILPFVNR